MQIQGFWTVALYFGLLGVIWLPRYYIVPTRLRLWPSFYLYNLFTNQGLVFPSQPPLNIGSEKLTLPSRNITFSIGHGNKCFSCNLNLQPRSCSSLHYSDLIFSSSSTPSDVYDVYGYESYPCYQRISKKTPQCPGMEAVDAGSANLFSGCTLCSFCHKHSVENASLTYRSYAYTPRFSISTDNENTILHCLNKLVLLKLSQTHDKSGEVGFCEALSQHISVYQEGGMLLVTGCSTFCTDSANLLYKELYNSELGVYLIVFATVVLLIAGVLSAIRFIVTLYRELGILNIQWNSSATCPICMDKLYRFTRLSTLRCGHTFCRSCLEQWLHVFNHVTCPLCRQPVDPSAPLGPGEGGEEGALMVAEPFHPIIPGGMEDPLDQDDMQSVTSDISMASSVQFVTQSIYNIGRNVVSGWQSSRINHEPASTSEETADTTIDHHLSTISQTSFTDRIQDDLSRPIPMPYYPLFPASTSHHHVPTNTSSISIVASYSSSTTTVVPSLSNPLCHEVTSLGHDVTGLGVMAFDTGALSDTELSLQNRIARKINRLRHRRLGRRSMSNPEITTSESEMDTFSR